MTTQVEEQKENFRRMLDESRSKSETALKGIDPAMVVYAESGWRVKDILAHLTAWEVEVTTSIRAYIEGQEYTIPGFSTDDAYNEMVFRRDYDVLIKQIVADWETTRTGLISAIRAIPEERFNGQIMCPWKLYSNIDGIVRDMVNHEAEHVREILSKAD